jgi:hypothetical protein
MKEVIIYGLLAGLTFVGFIGLLIIGLIRKRRNLILISIVIFLITISLGITTGYKIITKSYNKISEMTEPRSGEEIYNALFGKTDNDCLKISDYQDQIVPKIDYAIWLYFKTCPEECSRILSEFDYNIGELETKNWNSGTPLAENIEWWKPKEMGDTIIVYEYPIKEGKNIRTLWISKDSTEVYCRDILD